MLLTEAIRTGLPFWRPRHHNSWKVQGISIVSTVSNAVLLSPYVEDLLADDWKVEEPKVEITLSQFTNAYVRTMYSADQVKPTLQQTHHGVQLARALGLYVEEEEK